MHVLPVLSCVQVVSELMTEVVYVLLDQGHLLESDVEEPLEVAMGTSITPFDHGGYAGDHSPSLPLPGGDDRGGDGGLSPTHGGVPPTPTPLELAEAFGSRTQFRMGGLSIVHNNDGPRGWWFALQVTELYGDDMCVTGLDAHCTLFYLRSHQQHGEAVAAAMSRCLQQMIDRRGVRPTDFLSAGVVHQSSTAEYAWIDLLVSCPAHATLHRLANEGLAQVPQYWQVHVHPAFHLSFRLAHGVNLERVMGGGGLRGRLVPIAATAGDE